MTRRAGIGSHHSAAAESVEWFTPRDILAPLGVFDLDPCTSADRPWDTARRHFTRADDGLSQDWGGARVWCNPPYGAAVDRWMARMAEHGRGTALIFARTETACWFKHIWPWASAILFLDGRLHFHFIDGRRAKANAGGPSALIAYGEEDARCLRTCGLAGALVLSPCVIATAAGDA